MSAEAIIMPGIDLERARTVFVVTLCLGIAGCSALVVHNLPDSSTNDPGPSGTSSHSSNPPSTAGCPAKTCQTIYPYNFNVRYTNINSGPSKVTRLTDYIGKLTPKPSYITLEEVENAKGQATFVSNLHDQGYDCDVINLDVAMRTMTCWDRKLFKQVNGPMSERVNGKLAAGSTSHEAVNGRPIDGLMLESKVLIDHNGTKTTKDDHGVMIGIANAHPVHGVSEAGKPVYKKCGHCSGEKKLYDRYGETMEKQDDVLAAQRGYYASLGYSGTLAQSVSSDENTQLGDSDVKDPHLLHYHLQDKIDGKANPNAMTCNFDNPDKASETYKKTDSKFKEGGTFENGTYIDWICLNEAMELSNNLPLPDTISVSDHRPVGIKAFLRTSAN